MAAAVAVLVLLIAWRAWQVPDTDPVLRFRLQVIAPTEDIFEVFYRAQGEDFTTTRSVSLPVRASADPQELAFDLPSVPGAIQHLRIDPGNHPVRIQLQDAELHGPYHAVHFDAHAIDTLFIDRHHIASSRIDRSALVIACDGDDPFLASTLDLSGFLQEALDRRRPVIQPFAQAMTLAVAVFVAVFLLLRWSGRRKLPLSASLHPGRAMALILLADAFVFFGLLGLGERLPLTDRREEVRLRMSAGKDEQIQFFCTPGPQLFHAQNARSVGLSGDGLPRWIGFELPVDTPQARFRLDLGSGGGTLTLHALELHHGRGHISIPTDTLLRSIASMHDIDSCYASGGTLHIKTHGPDPYITFSRSWRSWLNAAADHTGRDIAGAIVALVLVIVLHRWLSAQVRIIQTWRFVVPADATLVLPFLAMLFFPLLLLLNPRLDPPQPYTEKRTLATLPDLTRTPLDSLPDRYESFYKDHFGARRTLFRWNSLLHAELLHTSPLPDRVVIGEDDWMYMMNANVFKDHRGLLLFTFSELEEVRLRLEHRRDDLAQAGIRYYLMIPPQKSAIYPEHLPAAFRHARAGGWLDQLADHLAHHSDVPLIDVRTELIAAKSERETYYRTDTHWTPYGAYFGYRKLLERMAADMPQVGPPWEMKDFEIKDERNTFGDLAMLIGLNDRMTRVTPTFIPLRQRQAMPGPIPLLPHREYFHAEPETFTVADSTKPRLLVFHDSFALYLKPLLAEHASHSTFVWTEHFIPEVVAAEKPDVVVQEIMELFAPDMRSDTPADSPPHKLN